MPEQEAGFLIDGKEYPIPDVNTFNLDEDQLLWDYASLARDDLVPVDPKSDDAEDLEAERQRRLRHPGLMRTLLHVAYQRGNPTVKPVVVNRLVGQVALIDVMSKMIEADDAGPPDASVSTIEPNESSKSESSETDSTTKPSPETSGNGSPTGSDHPDKTPASTGTGKSDTSSPASLLTT